LKKSITKRASGVAKGIGPEIKLHNCKKKKKKPKNKKYSVNLAYKEKCKKFLKEIKDMNK
jgi:hypothetical protein